MSKKKGVVKTGGASKPAHIAELQKEIDNFKFQIDELCENELPHLGAASPDRLIVYNKATGLKAELATLNHRLNGLSMVDGVIPTKKFESTKNQEKRRLDQLKKKLDDISEQLEPDEVEEDYFRTLSYPTTEDEDGDGGREKSDKNKKPQTVDKPQAVHKESNEENESEDIEYATEEEEDEEEEEESENDEYIECYAEGLISFNAEQDGDISFCKGEHLIILKKRDDGWWNAINEAGQKGVVPNTLIKVVDGKEKMKDLPASGNQNPDSTAPLQPKRSGKELWQILKEKKSVTDVTKATSVTDVLKAMNAVPPGFRNPTLGTWYQKEDNRISTWVIPKTGPSQQQFRDLYWDSINKRLRDYPVKLTRQFSLLTVRCIPPIGAGVEVLSRHVYVALWDEESILSNIHLVRAVPLESDLTWSFTPKIGKHIPSLYEGDFVTRIDSDDKKLSILFEFNYTYKRTSSGERSDVCCGWASLPLFEADGSPMPNKTFEMNINGGTPFEKDIPLDPTLMAASQSLMQSLIRSNQQPRITVKATSINRTTKEIYDMLPETIVACQSHSNFIGYFRQHAATMFCRDDTIYSGYVSDPLLSYFPRVLGMPDLMDALKIRWAMKSKSLLTRSQRKDIGQVQVVFKQSFTESAFALMQCATLPPSVWADDQMEQKRQHFIQTFMLHTDPLGNLLSPNYPFKPLDISKLAFTVLSKHSVDAPILYRGSLTEDS